MNSMQLLWYKLLKPMMEHSFISLIIRLIWLFQLFGLVEGTAVMSLSPLDSVVELASQYKEEFECGFSELRKRAAAVSGLSSKEIIKQRDMMFVTIRDTQSVLPDLDTLKLMSAFSWMAVMLLGLSIGSILGGILFSPLLGFFISGTDAVLMAYIILPLTAYSFLQLPMEATERNDLLRRHVLFCFAVVEGFLTGYIFSNKDLIGMPPFAAFTPIAIGMIPHFGSSVIGKDHSKLIWLTTGGGLILHLSLGAIIDLSLPYLLLAGFYALIGFATLQLYVKSAGKDLTLTHMYQLSFVCAVIFSQALIYAIFGLDEKELAEATRSSSSFL